MHSPSSFEPQHVQSYENINQLWAETIVEELARSGVRHAVISPGSRSTPMVLAFVAHPDITDHSVIDERSAAFFALGMAKELEEPVVLLCTSGTAAANYFPAVCEADAARVPLLLLTADRPVSLRDSGAPQTMDQLKLYGDHVRWFSDTGLPEADRHRLRALRSVICHAVVEARTPRPGPVHVNLPFRKPLEPTPTGRAEDEILHSLVEHGGEAVQGRRDGRAWLRVFDAARDDGALEEIADALLRARRPVILVGPDADGHRLAEPLLHVAERHGIPIFAEAASQLRSGYDSSMVVSTFDLLLRSANFRARCNPDLVLQLGGVPTNAAVQRFLDQEQIPHYCLTPDTGRRDATHTVRVQVSGNLFEYILRLSDVLDRVPPRTVDTDFLDMLRRADTVARAELDARCTALPALFEGAVLRRCISSLPAQSAVIVSSSMPIRDLETFVPDIPDGCRLHFNRGVNGIDGMVSTALGVARARHGIATAMSVDDGRRAAPPTFLITGDIAFLHNLNAAAGERLRDIPLTVLLLNNDGGEIFDMLPVRAYEPAFTRHFLTPQGADFSAACGVFGIGYHRVEHMTELAPALDAACAAGDMQVIEVRTDLARSGEMRRTLLRDIATAVDAALANTADIPFLISDSFPLSWRILAEGTGETVLLLHGFTRSSASWRGMPPGFGAGRRVIGVDLIGHGASSTPDPFRDHDAYRLEHAADALRDLISRLGCGPVHLVGYSLGGRTALHAAVRFPALFRTLALLSTNPGLETDEARASRTAEDAARAARLGAEGLERFVDEWMALPLFRRQWSVPMREWTEARRDRLRQRTRGLQGSLLGSGQGTQDSLWPALPRIALPVLVAAGAEDTKYAAIAERMAGILPNARLALFVGAGHDIPAEQPAALAHALEAHWKR